MAELRDAVLRNRIEFVILISLPLVYCSSRLKYNIDMRRCVLTRPLEVFDVCSLRCFGVNFLRNPMRYFNGQYIVTILILMNGNVT